MSDASDTKTCCAAVYGSEAARALLGERFHPGGAALTKELVDGLALTSRALALDVACGLGTSALQLAHATGAHVTGVDLAAENVARASARASAEHLEDRVRFVVADAERLPFADATFDGVICECALCLFTDKAAAAREVARVLRPGGRLALSDVTMRSGSLAPELRTLAGHVACLSGALSFEGILHLLTHAGFTIVRARRRDAAMRELVDRVAARMRFARILDAPELARHVEDGVALTAAARDAVARGSLGYAVVIARR